MNLKNYPLLAISLLFILPLTSLRAQQTQDWCDVDPWPILAGCGSLSVGLQFSGDDVFCNGETVTILNTLPSTADSTLVCWGDGSFTAVAGTPMTFTHVYAFPPDTCVDECITFIIRLAVLKHCPPDKMSFKWVATPVQVCFPPIALFTMPLGVCIDDPVSINNLSCENDPFPTYNWSFPGATPSSDMTASPGPITYPLAGTYQASLTLSNQVCGTDTYTQSITVGPEATAVATLPDTICANEIVMPTNTSQNVAAVNPFHWSFPTNPGGGAMFVPPSNTSDAMPKMRFTLPGTYVVRLQVTGCHNPVWTHTIYVKGPPVISHSDTLPDVCTDPVTINPGLFLGVSNAVSGEVNWTFGGNATPATFNGLNPPSVMFSGFGMKTVCVDANGQCGHPALCDTFFIKTPGIANFAMPSVLCAPNDTLMPQNNSTNANSFVWTILQNGNPVGAGVAQFIGGTTNQSANPNIRFLQEGTFTVRLSTGAAPCGTLFEQTIEVHLSPTVSIGNVPLLCNDTIFNPLSLVTFGGGIPDQFSWVFFNGNPATFTGQDPGPVSFSGLQTFGITIISQNVCDTVMAVDSFQIIALPQIMLDTIGPFCSSDSPQPLIGSPLGGNWSGVGISGTIFDPGNVPPSSWNTPLTIGYSIGMAGNSCFAASSMPVTVWGTVVGAGMPETACTEDGVLLLSGATPAGGIWSGVGITDPNTGAFDPGTVPGSGNYTVTYTVTDSHGCVNSATKIVKVSGPPQLGGSITHLCVGELLPLDSFSVTGGGTCHWDFGDGTMSNLCNPVKSYSVPGTYLITLQANSADGCNASLSFSIDVIPPPDAVMALDTTFGCAVLPVTFTNASNLNIYTTYSWDFGNDSTAITMLPNANPPLVQYGQVETTTVYTATLTAQNGCGTATQSADITVFPRPIVRFGAARSVICSSDTVTFNNYSTGEPDVFQWFVNGVLVWNLPQLPPQHFTTGTQDSLYVVTLVGINECGSDTLRDTVLVRPNPVYAFYNLPVSAICQYSTIRLTDLSTNGLNVTWNFGDGNTAIGDTVWHTFNTSGVFQIYEYVNNGCGYDTTFKQITVWPAPEAVFEHLPYVCLLDTIAFQNNSVDIAGSHWAFGDGGADTTLTSPEHLYQQAGTYPVTLIVFSETHLCPDTAFSSVLVRALPVPAVTMPQTAGCQPFTFTGAGATPGNNTYIWDFGDGTPGDGLSFSHLYADTGVFVLQVTVTDGFNCRADSTIFPIIVHPKPLADFIVDQTNLCETPANLVFNNTSLLADAYEWVFQGGQVSNLEHPEILVSTGGPFFVTLYAENQWNCLDTASKTLTIYAQPNASFSIVDSSGCAAFEAIFDNTSQNVNQYFWDFGDGYTSRAAQPSHLYEQPGLYTVRLFSSADSVCFADVQQVGLVRVWPSPTADFTFEPVTDTTVVPNGIYRFFDASTPDVSEWDWDFGDQMGFSTEENPIYRFDTIGEKVVTLIAANLLGCVDTVQMTIRPDFFGSLFIPNALTPDAGTDGERLFLPAGANLIEYDLSIYAPNGQCVFHSTQLDRGHPSEAWDGTYREQPLPQGVYYWKVRAKFSNNRYWQGMQYSSGGPVLTEGKVWLGR